MMVDKGVLETSQYFGIWDIFLLIPIFLPNLIAIICICSSHVKNNLLHGMNIQNEQLLVDVDPQELYVDNLANVISINFFHKDAYNFFVKRGRDDIA